MCCVCRSVVGTCMRMGMRFSSLMKIDLFTPVKEHRSCKSMLLSIDYQRKIRFWDLSPWYVICAHPSNALHLMLAKIQHQDNRISALTVCALYCAGFLNCARFVDQNQGHLFLLILRTCAPCLLCRVASGALGIDYLHQRLGKVGSHVDGWPRVPRQRSHL